MRRLPSTLHLVIARYLEPTEHRGARVVLTSGRFSGRVVLPFDYCSNSIGDQAEKWLTAHKFHPVARCELGQADGILCKRFAPLKGAP